MDTDSLTNSNIIVSISTRGRTSKANCVELTMLIVI